MSRVEKTALVAYSAECMYELVADVDRYNEFLPWCKSSQLLSRDEENLCGEIEVAKAGVVQKFATCNALTPFSRMDITLKEGPFKQLSGYWEFISLKEDACKIVLVLDFEFSNRLMNGAFGIVFHQIANTMVDSFCKRASDLDVG